MGMILVESSIVRSFPELYSVGAVRSIDLIRAMLRTEFVGAVLRIDLVGALLRIRLVVGDLRSIYIAVVTRLRTHILICRSQECPKGILCCIQVFRTTDLNRMLRATTVGVLELCS